jgi:hypothetical protein
MNRFGSIFDTVKFVLMIRRLYFMERFIQLERELKVLQTCNIDDKFIIVKF